MTGNGPSVYTDQINSAADLEITGILDESNEGPARTRLEDALRSCITICESYFSGKITKREAVTQCRKEMSQCTSYIEATKVGLERKQREREELERKEQEKNLTSVPPRRATLCNEPQI